MSWAIALVLSRAARHRAGFDMLMGEPYTFVRGQNDAGDRRRSPEAAQAESDAGRPRASRRRQRASSAGACAAETEATSQAQAARLEGEGAARSPPAGSRQTL